MSMRQLDLAFGGTMNSSGSVRSRRAVVAAAALLAVVAASLMALAMSRDSQAGDVRSKISHRFSVLDTNEASGVQVVDPKATNDAGERAKIRRATPTNPVVFEGGPVDTRRIRRSDARRGSRSVADGSNVRGTWVAPSSNGGVCVLVTISENEVPGGTCSNSAGDLTGSITFIFGRGTNGIAVGETIIAGAVPDDVTGVLIELADATSTTVAVVENAFSFDTTVPILRYSFVTDEGTTDPTPVQGDPDA